MKRILIILITSLLLIVTACGDGDGAENTSATNKKENENTTEENGDEVTDPPNKQDKEEVNDNESGDSEWGEDQLDLKIGDTGTVNNNFTSYEVTVNSVEYMDKIGDELPQNDRFVLVELTIKNLGKDSYSAEDILSSANLTESPGTSGTWPIIMEGIAEEWPGELSTNESQTGVLLFDISNSDEYALQLGTSHKSLSNEVRILFTDADAK